MIEVPDDWAIEPLASVATQVRRRVPVEHGRTYRLLGVRWYATGPFLKAEKPGVDIKSRYLYQVRSGDLIYNRLFGWKGSFGIVDDALDACYVSGEFPTFSINRDRASAEYVWRFFSLPSVWRAIENRSSGSTRTSRLRFKEEDFLSMRIPLPPLKEQVAIARVLRVVEQAKEATEQVGAAAEVLEKSLMQHLCSHGLTERALVDPSDLVETLAGKIPKNWQALSMADLGAVGNGSTPKRSKSEYWEGGTIPWITSAKVHDGVIERADEFVTELAKEECHLPLVPSGSVVIAISGQGKTLGNAAVVGLDTTLNQHLAYVRLNGDLVDATFLVGYLSHQYADLQAAGRAGGSTRAALTCGFLAQYPIPVPPLDEQREIAKILKGIRAKVAAEYARRDALATLFDSLLRDLVTGRLRVTDVEVSV